MKTILTTLLVAALPAIGLAQNQQPQAQKRTTVQTEHVHRGASHQHTRTVVPTEHRSRTTWHYHSGAKRPQVPVQGTEPAETQRKAPENVKEAGK